MNKTGVECPQCRQKTDESPCGNCGYDFDKQKHACSWDSVEWENYGDGNPRYYVAGCGETLERNGKCKVCGKKFREVYLHSCVIDEETGKETTL